MIDVMLDQIELVFSRLTQFNPKIKPKYVNFFKTSMLFLGHVLSAEGISTKQKRFKK